MKTGLLPSVLLLGPIVCLLAQFATWTSTDAARPVPGSSTMMTLAAAPASVSLPIGGMVRPIAWRVAPPGHGQATWSRVSGSACQAQDDTAPTPKPTPDSGRLEADAARRSETAPSSVDPCSLVSAMVEQTASRGEATTEAASQVDAILRLGRADEPLTAGEIVDVAAAVVTDLDAYWARAFATEGRYYSPPTYVLIEGVTPTPCAWDGAVTPGHGSFYCPWNQTIYLDVATIQAEAARYGVAGLVFTLAHEWGHHAQFQRGALQERSRVVELGADCLAGSYLADAVGRGWIAAELVSDDVRGIVATLGDPLGLNPADAQAHGSGEQRTAMLLAGYAGGAAVCGS